MNIIIGYLKANWAYATAITYMLFTCILKLATGINITMPCLVKIIFGVHCPGCGLTTAGIQLLQLNFYSAWEHNPLIFLVVPLGIIYIVRHFLQFKRKTKSRMVSLSS